MNPALVRLHHGPHGMVDTVTGGNPAPITRPGFSSLDAQDHELSAPEHIAAGSTVRVGEADHHFPAPQFIHRGIS